jgi:hypothetical protein
VAFGLSLTRFMTLAFAISAFYAGVAGALYAIAIAFVNPDTFPVSLSILLLTGAVIGGLGSLSGMIFGALFIEFAPIYAQNLNQSASSVLYGVILIAVLYALPGGAGAVIESLLLPRRASRLRRPPRRSRGSLRPGRLDARGWMGESVEQELGVGDGESAARSGPRVEPAGHPVQHREGRPRRSRHVDGRKSPSMPASMICLR